MGRLFHSLIVLGKSEIYKRHYLYIQHNILSLGFHVFWFQFPSWSWCISTWRMLCVISYMVHKILWTFLFSQSKIEKSNWQCSRHFEWNSLIFVYGVFPSFIPDIWNFGVKKLTSVFYASVLLLMTYFVIKLSKFKMMALNRIYRIFLNFAKRFVWSCLSKVGNRKKFTLPFWIISP